MSCSIDRWWLVLALCATMATHADTDPLIDVRDPSIWMVEYENDIFVGRDRYYTSGLRLSRISEAREAPSWLESVAVRFPGFSDADTLPYRLSIAHNIFTPSDIENPTLPPDDRPYAAWLHTEFSTGTLHPRGVDRVRVGLGITGPPALGEHAQKNLHKLIGSPAPRGWGNQVRTEPTLQLGYDRIRRFLDRAEPDQFGFDLAWLGGVTMGNAQTYLTAGGYARLGHNLPNDYGPPRITPATSGSAWFREVAAESSFYVFLGMEGRRVFRDMFLQGNTFGGVDGVSIERQVGEYFAGMVYTHGVLRLAYTHVWRTREFPGQTSDQSYGAFAFSLWW